MYDEIDSSKKINWSIIGAGNGGQTMAGHLGIEGQSVCIYDVFQSTIDAINEKKGIKVQGEINGFGPLALATCDMQKAIENAHVINVVVPAVYHKDIAKSCAPFLKDGQIIVLHPGATFGAFEFKKVLENHQCRAKVTIAEALSLLYACRAEKPGHATIFGVKKSLKIASLPATDIDRVVKLLNTVFPQYEAANSILETSIGNLNAMMHPGPTVLNTSKIDSREDFLYYWEGITPIIGDFVEGLDRERIGIAEALGIEMPPLRDAYWDMYRASGDGLHEIVKDNKAYDGIKGQKTLNTRYLTEDIPTGLCPLVSLGKLLGVPVDRMETIAKLGGFLLNRDFAAEGRSVKSAGLDNLTAEQIVRFAQTGQY